MKRLLATIFMIIFAFSLCGCGTSQKNGETPESDFKYGISKKGTITITKYNGESEQIVIPSKMEGKSVAIIGSNAFLNCKSVKSVKIPEGVDTIGESAFSGCENLIYVEMPNTITAIFGGAFWNCKSLKSVSIPNGVTTLGENAFMGCESLCDVKLPDDIKIIDLTTFLGCENIQVTYKGNVYNYDELFELRQLLEE